MTGSNLFRTVKIHDFPDILIKIYIFEDLSSISVEYIYTSMKTLFSLSSAVEEKNLSFARVREKHSESGGSR